MKSFRHAGFSGTHGWTLDRLISKHLVYLRSDFTVKTGFILKSSTLFVLFFKNEISFVAIEK